jgi:Flp pilus assembly protein TadD
VDEHKGETKGAKQEYLKVLDVYPAFSPAQKRLAILYSNHAEDDKKAVELATKAREAYPGDSEVSKALGILLYRTRNYSRASVLLNESARDRASDAEVLFYLGASQRENKEQAAGTRSLQRALELGLTGSLATEARRLVSSAK